MTCEYVTTIHSLLDVPNKSESKKRKGQMAKLSDDVRGIPNDQRKVAVLDRGLDTEVELTDDNEPNSKKPRPLRDASNSLLNRLVIISIFVEKNQLALDRNIVFIWNQRWMVS